MTRPPIAMSVAMESLSRLAGWLTVPHPADHAVVRLALRTARDRHNPDAGGSQRKADLIDQIEEVWLDSLGIG